MVSDLKTVAHKGYKIAAHKKNFLGQILPYKQDFFGIGATIRIDKEILCFAYAEFLLSFYVVPVTLLKLF